MNLSTEITALKVEKQELKDETTELYAALRGDADAAGRYTGFAMMEFAERQAPLMTRLSEISALMVLKEKLLTSLSRPVQKGRARSSRGSHERYFGVQRECCRRAASVKPFAGLVPSVSRTTLVDVARHSRPSLRRKHVPGQRKARKFVSRGQVSFLCRCIDPLRVPSLAVGEAARRYSFVNT